MEKQIIFWDRHLWSCSKENGVFVDICVDGWMDSHVVWGQILFAESFHLEMCQIYVPVFGHLHQRAMQWWGGGIQMDSEDVLANKFHWRSCVYMCVIHVM